MTDSRTASRTARRPPLATCCLLLAIGPVVGLAISPVTGPLVGFCAAADGESGRPSDRQASDSPDPATAATVRAGSSGFAERRPFQLVPEDPAAPQFAAGPVLRTSAIIGDAQLNDVCHVGDSCWAVGERGVLLHSVDSGATWNAALIPFECSLQTVCFLTNRIGWAAGTRCDLNGPERQAVLLQTRDGGATWADLQAEGGESGRRSVEAPRTGAVSLRQIPGILRLQFFDLEEAAAVTLPVRSLNGATVFRTQDGGRWWYPVASDQATNDDHRPVWTSAAFLNANEGILAGEALTHGVVVSDQFITVGQPLATLRQIRGVSLAPDGTGWLVGDGGFLLVTADAGVTWKAVETPLSDHRNPLADFQAVGQKGAVVLLSGSPASLILRSADRGETWQSVRSGVHGEIRQFLFVEDSTVLALGTLGTILRSVDAGESWECVRSAGHRAGILNLVTDLRQASWELLAAESGDAGYRAVMVQLSPEARSHSTDSDSRSRLEALQAATQLGANAVVREWAFPRNQPELHLSRERLIAEWNRQSDGQLQRQLPLRLARLIRIWRPSVLVIESLGDEDAVADVLRRILPQAMKLAQVSDEQSAPLAELFLEPWTVQRVVTRCASDRATALTYHSSDLLERIGTTCGLVRLSATRPFGRAAADIVRPSRVSYEILEADDPSVTVPELFGGLTPPPGRDARRAVTPRSREELQTLQETARAAQLEQAAIAGHLSSASTENALTAHLQEIGTPLPPALALQQLLELAELCRRRDDIDGYTAVLQEIIRRFPGSVPAVAASETLFLCYSSMEIRRWRLEQIERRGQPEIGSGISRAALRESRPAPPGLAVPESSPEAEQSDAVGTGPGTVHPDLPSGALRPSGSLQPDVTRAAVVGFLDSSRDVTAMLMERWDQQAANALRLLQPKTPEDVSSAVILRQAANLRIAARSGEQNTLLAELAARTDSWSVYASAESQIAHGTATPPLPVINVRKAASRPWLDAALTDGCWEQAEEIFLSSETHPDEPEHSSALLLLSWDDDFLYLAGRIERLPDSGSIEPLAVDRDHDANHGSRDRVELELDLDRDYSTAFCFSIDETGCTRERCWQLNSWNPEWYAAAASDETTWRFECAIPLKHLDLRQTRAGDLWGVRLRRIAPGRLSQTLASPANTPFAADGTGLIRLIRSQKR